MFIAPITSLSMVNLLLNLASLSCIFKYRLLKRKHEKRRYTARGEIYAKSWELRENIEKGKKFSPFIYRLK
jgi:hypothetical protein